MEIYSQADDCDREVHYYNYRSIHYIVPATNIQSAQVYCEIQTRTIFEEGWSEIDHKVRYPDYSDDKNLMSYLNIFNRLAGSADEMGSYVNDLVLLIKKNNELENERAIKEIQFTSEKEILQQEIENLSTKDDDIIQIRSAYENLIELQNREIDELKKEIDSSSIENNISIKNKKTPVAIILRQKDNEILDGVHRGEVSIKVIRENKFASFIVRLSAQFSDNPIIEVKPLTTTGKETKISDLNIKTGVGNYGNFNVHIFNAKLGYIEKGEYTFSFEVKVG